MARYDKYEPKAGGFRAPLAADLAATESTGDGNPLGFGLDVNGRAVPGAGQSGLKGIVCTTKAMKAGDIVDIMTDGEVVEFDGVAGTTYYAAAADGVISTTAPAADDNGVTVGFTVEATRLVVRVAQVQG